MKKLFILILTLQALFANSLYSATWEDFKANSKDAEFVYQSYYWDGGSIGYEFEYKDNASGEPQSVFITDTKRKFLNRNSRNIFVDIGSKPKHFGDNGFELKDDSDKAFLIDLLLRFADYKEIHDTLKFLGKDVAKAPTKDTPKEMEKRIQNHIEERLMEERLMENKLNRLEKENANFEETMHAYISTDSETEPKLAKFLKENPKIEEYITTSSENHKDLCSFFDIKDKDEEIFVILSCLERFIDYKDMPIFRYKDEYNEKLAGLYGYILDQADGVIPYKYAELIFKSLKSDLNYINGQQEEFDIACLEKILGKKPSGYTREFYLENRNKPNFKEEKQALIQKWEDFYIKNYK